MNTASTPLQRAIDEASDLEAERQIIVHRYTRIATIRSPFAKRLDDARARYKEVRERAAANLRSECRLAKLLGQALDATEPSIAPEQLAAAIAGAQNELSDHPEVHPESIRVEKAHRVLNRLDDRLGIEELNERDDKAGARAYAAAVRVVSTRPASAREFLEKIEFIATNFEGQIFTMADILDLAVDDLAPLVAPDYRPDPATKDLDRNWNRSAGLEAE